MRQVLLVDDEPDVLVGLSKALRVKRDWQVSTAEGGQRALELLAARPFDVLVTDALMPDVDGEAVLREACQRWPQTLRVVLTGEVKAAAAGRLVTLAQHLLSKPTRPADLYARVEASLQAQARLTAPGLQALVGSLGALPALSEVQAEAVRLLRQPDYEVAEVVELVGRDPGMCANVLKLVNSAWYAPPRPVTSLREALWTLGAAPLQALVLAVGVFKGPGSARLLADAARRQAVVRELARALRNPPWAEPAMMAATVCDVGRLLLLQRRVKESAEVEAAVQAGARRADAEREVFGADHAQVGSVLLAQWGLPTSVVEAVALHHQAPLEPAPAAALALVSAVMEQAPDERLQPLAAVFGLGVAQARALGGPASA